VPYLGWPYHLVAQAMHSSVETIDILSADFGKHHY
jgi:hypothetical protein